MAGKITTNSVVLGDSITDTQNFVLKTNADGTATLARGALGGLGTVFGVNGSGALTGATLVSPTITGLTAAALPAGSVIQVVNATYSTVVSNSTSTYADTGLTATITPTKNTSKILVLVNQSAIQRNAGDNSAQVFLRLVRNASVLFSILDGWSYTGYSAVFPTGAASTCYLDSPATTSATIYKTQFMQGSNSASALVQVSNSTSTITLMEIAG